MQTLRSFNCAERKRRNSACGCSFLVDCLYYEVKNIENFAIPILIKNFLEADEILNFSTRNQLSDSI